MPSVRNDPLDAFEGEANSLLLQRVYRFHRKMGQQDPGAPIDLTPEQRMKRARLIAEEATEVLHALVGGAEAWELLCQMDDRVTESRASKLTGDRATLSVVGLVVGDLAEIADGCVDLQVVCAGTLSEAGIADMPLIEAVMDANDAKVGGGVDAHGKYVKPPGWKPPPIAELLRAQGWKGP